MKLRFLLTEFLAGLTTSMAMIPECMAFAILAGVNPMYGLYTSFAVGLVAAILGRPALISGGAGAIAIVSTGLVSVYGPEYLFAAVLLMGLIQILAGFLNIGKYVYLIKEPIMVGFLSGLAIIIFTSQFIHFQSSHGTWLPIAELVPLLLITVSTICIMVISKRYIKSIPSPLIAIACIVIVLELLGAKTLTLGDVANIQGGFPQAHIPLAPFTWETLLIILPYSLVMATIGLLESILTKNVVDAKLGESVADSDNQECIAQGIANTVSGFLFGIGGCGMIGQTLVNLESNGRSRWSGAFMALSILLFILIGAPVISKIPIACLAAVMFLIAVKAFRWDYFKSKTATKYDYFVALSVTVVTLLTHNLAIAVSCGIVLMYFNGAYKKSR